MNPSAPSDESELSRDDMMSAIFAQMVLQQANLALMLLGRVPHPQTGKTEKDVDAARAFIDQLEMLEVKTKGNLSPQEAAFLKDTLMSVRMASPIARTRARSMLSRRAFCASDSARS